MREEGKVRAAGCLRLELVGEPFEPTTNLSESNR